MITKERSKCLTCQHYCKLKLVDQMMYITVVNFDGTTSQQEWFKNENVCTKTGYMPMMDFSTGEGIPLVIDCSDYELEYEVAKIPHIESITEEPMHVMHSAIVEEVGKKPYSTMQHTATVTFNVWGEAKLPRDCKDVQSLFFSGMEFFEGTDFVEEPGKIVWTNQTFKMTSGDTAKIHYI